MFQPPQPGFNLMQLPQQARQQYQQMPGMTPQMLQSQNLMAAQGAQQQGQQQQAQQNDLSKNLLMGAPGAGNPLMNKPPAGDPSQTLPIAPGMYPTQDALEKAQGQLFQSPYQAQQSLPWLQRTLGIPAAGGSNGWLSSLFGA